MELLSSTKSFGGWLKRYQHHSTSVKSDMTFAIFLPPQAETQRVPVLYWLSGLTCTDENFMQKAGAFRKAAELGLALVCPDTSPRGTDYPSEHESYDFGSGAGFYVNATVAPYSNTYRMYDYVVEELPTLVEAHFPVTDKRSISGHSMGGHGALICALKNPGVYQSVSAFAPIVHPTNCPWGEKAFTGYLGEDRATWKEWDATCLIESLGESTEARLPLFIDQGEADNFLVEQLKPEALEAACEKTGHPITLRRQPGYDHSYFFIASFIDEHLEHHSKALS
ncbi:S-formylglutathione hydrolase [Marinomonas sp. IMCC 4694]|uniref:S-formylglutathione hydrolase n=1 Tax=Marinomonas sp. IMCC 4694 TaxID=2605432 RepID=UPI0011E7105D|nr:S-formylglutathione hydrolase [Marinomonas sp. IMCC 4694]TYL48758.1 S-formylglutathione hydrolase [Marinomonas sp. IMCC 4694]